MIPDEPTIPNLPVTRRERQLEARSSRTAGWRGGWILYSLVAALVIVGAAFWALASL